MGKNLRLGKPHGMNSCKFEGKTKTYREGKWREYADWIPLAEQAPNRYT